MGTLSKLAILAKSSYGLVWGIFCYGVFHCLTDSFFYFNRKKVFKERIAGENVCKHQGTILRQEWKKKKQTLNVAKGKCSHKLQYKLQGDERNRR